ncbi:hypothetical protein [Coleofasciculus sp. B1-GNL1-01]|uniref:hypothetical protein n=1 Tax=Coleofasciculus sp. B1-GNL1-01 TaxID=3068484 RepID=UPI0040635FF1
MSIEREMIDNHGVNLPYEQPSIKKYGTMKEFTLGSSGSGGDGMGSDAKTEQNTRINDVNQNASAGNDDPRSFDDNVFFGDNKNSAADFLIQDVTIGNDD